MSVEAAPRWTSLGLAILAGAASCGIARSQSLFRTLDGHRQWFALERVEPVGDLDGDGVQELFYESGGRAYRGVRNGATWQDVWGPVIDSPTVQMGAAEARVIGDWNGDGAADLGFAYYNGLGFGRVVVRSSLDGADLAVIERVSLNDFARGGLAPAGDVNGDGLADVVVISPPSRATVYAAPQGTLLHDVIGLGDIAGAAPMGDLDGDGLDDIGVAWSTGSQLDLVSGIDGDLIARLQGPEPGDTSPRDFSSLATLGDLTGDGVPEFAVAVLQFTCTTCGNLRGYVEAFDGATREPIWRTPCPSDLPPFSSLSLFGLRMQSGQDVNGDGVRDLWVLGSQSGARLATILSGRTGTILYRFDRLSLAAAVGESFPLWMIHGDFVGDLDGDGLSEFAIVNTRASVAGQQYAGRAYIFRGSMGDAVATCAQGQHSAGGPGRLVVAGAITADEGTLPLRLLDCAPSGVGLLFFGAAAAAGATIPVGSGALCIDPAGLQRIPTPVAIDAQGAGGLDVEWAAPPLAGLWIGGSTWTIQAGFRDAGDPLGAGATNAVEVTFTR